MMNSLVPTSALHLARCFHCSIVVLCCCATTVCAPADARTTHVSAPRHIAAIQSIVARSNDTNQRAEGTKVTQVSLGSKTHFASQLFAQVTQWVRCERQSAMQTQRSQQCDSDVLMKRLDENVCDNQIPPLGIYQLSH